MDLPKFPGSAPNPAAMAGMVKMMMGLQATVERTVYENGGKGLPRERREALVEALTTEVLNFLITELPAIMEAGGEGDDE